MQLLSLSVTGPASAPDLVPLEMLGVEESSVDPMTDLSIDLREDFDYDNNLV